MGSKRLKTEHNISTRSKDIIPVTSINELPNEILLHIFSYLKPPDIKFSITRVCRNWLALSKDMGLWRHLHYYTTTTRSSVNGDETWSAVKKFLKSTPQLQHMIISKDRTIEEIRTILLIVMKYCIHLRGIELNTDWVDCSSSFILLPKHLNYIEYLKINISKENYDKNKQLGLIKVLNNFKNLNRIILLDNNFKIQELELFLNNVPNLKHLDMSNDVITINEFNVLNKFKNQFISLNLNITNLKCEQIENLNNFVNLKKVKLKDQNTSSLKLMDIGRLKCLTSLHLQEDAKSSVLTNTMLINFFRDGVFDCLEILKLIKIRICDEGIREIRRNCKQLAYLNIETHQLWAVAMTEVSLMHLFHCQKLREIDIMFRTSKPDWLYKRNKFTLHDCNIDRRCPLEFEEMKSNWDEIYVTVDVV